MTKFRRNHRIRRTAIGRRRLTQIAVSPRLSRTPGPRNKSQ